jgi:AcrR family transcriptional regulator
MLESPGRPYESSLRRAQAQTTRTYVLDAAAALFVREGYPRTTTKAIATKAGTSVETVYARGSKAALLLAWVTARWPVTTTTYR